MSNKDTQGKKKSFRRYLQALGVIIIFLATYFSGIYGYRCFVEKVCESEVIERVVRHDIVVAMPKGEITAEVVATKSSRALGLSGRSKMQDSEGMLFIFDVPGKYGFWMKDMNFPLDIIWINANGVVVWVERNVTPDSYPKAFINKADASYVLEINAGLSEKFGVYLGSKVKIGE